MKLEFMKNRVPIKRVSRNEHTYSILTNCLSCGREITDRMKFVHVCDRCVNLLSDNERDRLYYDVAFPIINKYEKKEAKDV